jgi:hypothetical protein
MKVETNQRLEELSDKVRRGIPIGFNEALEVIKYQEGMRNKKWYHKLLNKLTFKSE